MEEHVEQQAASALEMLALADWRRRVADLYAEVRRLAANDPLAALTQWREVREWLYREHPGSPIPPDARTGFRARHFPHDPSLRFELTVAAEPAGGATETHLTPTGSAAAAEPAQTGIVIPISSGNAADSSIAAMSFRRLGWVTVPFPRGTRQLALAWLEDYAGGLFLSFRDSTNGAETYGAGRYLLDAAKGAELGGDLLQGRLILDFNFAYHPSCAFNPRWVCPLVPPENRLDLPIRAGERLV